MIFSDKMVFGNEMEYDQVVKLLADLILRCDGTLKFIMEEVIEWEGNGYSGALRETRFAGGGGDPAEGPSLDSIECSNPMWAYEAIELAQTDGEWSKDHQAIFDACIERRTEALLENWGD